MINLSALRELLTEEQADIGHGIYPFEPFYEIGFTAEDLARFRDVHQSGPGKWQLESADGRPVSSLCGIYGLEFVEWLAGYLKADTSKVRALGRGTRAVQLVDAILAKLPPCHDKATA